jgi:hypothetical protein
MPDDVFYCPQSIGSLTGFLSASLKRDGTLKHRHGFLKNIGYSLQYLDYLNNLLSEPKLHATVRTLTQKTFIVTGMGIVEALLWYVLRANKQQAVVEWRELPAIVEWRELPAIRTNEFDEGTSRRRMRIIIEEKLATPEDAEMNLDSMRKKVESKKLLGVNEQVYRDLNHLRTLRNRVHLHVQQGDTDTDWYKFGERHVELMKAALYGILSSDLFAASADRIELFDFLKPKPAAQA